MMPFQVHREPASLRSLWPLLLPAAGLALCLKLASGWLDEERREFWTADSLAQLERLTQAPVAESIASYLVQAQRLLPALKRLHSAPGEHYVHQVETLASRLMAAGPGPQSALDQQALRALAAAQLTLTAALQQEMVSGQRQAAQILTALVATALAAAMAGVFFLRQSAAERITPMGFRSRIDQQLFEESPVPMVCSDSQDLIQAVNAAYLRMTGYSEDELLGRPVLSTDSGRQGASEVETMRTALARDGRWQGELWMRNKRGEAYANKVLRLRVGDSSKSHEGYLTVSRESLQADEQQRLMLWQAHHDPLTKLPNRIMLEERLTRALLQETPMGVLLSLDIDGFKEVNDSVGPVVGDQVLMDAAMRLAMCADEDDTVARLGGDTFVIVSETNDPERRAEALTAELGAALMEPIRAGDAEIFLKMSIGIVSFPKDGENGAELLQKADAARGEVKKSGGDGVGYFQVEINQRAERRLQLQSALRSAIVDGELSLALQPVMILGEQKLLGAEALIRWHHPTLGNISPGEFIPIAESSGLIYELGLWVVQQSGQIIHKLRQAGLEDLRLSLNVSPVQLQRRSACDDLLDALRGSPTHQIVLEITENALMDHSDSAKYFIDRARRMGCQVALDDFGTGYSSLAYLREFNFDVLKVDKAFIDRLDSPRDLGLVASIISMGKILGMRVVAEGVEKPRQLEQLRQIGCHYVQGFLLSRPMPYAEFEAFALKAGDDSGSLSQLAGG